MLLLKGDLVGRALENKSAGAGIKPLVVFAHDDKINVLRLFAFERAEALVVELDRAQIDVLLQLEAQPEQDALFQNARFDLGMADGAQENRRKLAQLRHDAVGHRFLGAKVAFAPQIVMGVVEFQIEFPAGRVEDLDGLADDFRPGAVAGDNCNRICLHSRREHCFPSG